MSDGPKTAPDFLNTFGIAVVGVVATVVTWGTVVALQAYYSSTAEELAEKREVTGQEAEQRSVKAAQLRELKGGDRNANSGIGSIDIEQAKKLVTKEAKDRSVASLVPAIGGHDKPTVPAVWGRPPDDAKPPTDVPEEPATPEPTEGQPANGNGQPANGQPANGNGQPANGQPANGQPANGQPANGNGQPANGQQ